MVFWTTDSVHLFNMMDCKRSFNDSEVDFVERGEHRPAGGGSCVNPPNPLLKYYRHMQKNGGIKTEETFFKLSRSLRAVHL